MTRNKVTSIQFASLLVPILLSVLANAYIQHDDRYYDEPDYHTEDNEIDDHDPSYRYEYQVNSPHTGDYKTQHEERIGDMVRGSYSLIEPDGSRRIVEYTADALHGFRAVVKREPPAANFPQPHAEPAAHFHQPHVQPAAHLHHPHVQPAAHLHHPHVQPAAHLHHPHVQPAAHLHHPHVQPAAHFHQPHVQPAAHFHQPHVQPAAHFHQSHVQPVAPFHQPQVQPAPVPTPLGHARPVPTTLPEPVTTNYPKKLFYSVPQSYYFQTQKPQSSSVKYFPFLRRGWPFSY